MFTSVISFIETVLLPYGAFGVFFGSILEEIIAPIPSAFVQMGSGFILLSKLNGLDFVLALIIKVAIPAALGVSVGSLLIYYIFRTWGHIGFKKFGKYFGVSLLDIEKIENKLTKTSKDEYIYMLLRTFPIVPSALLSAFLGLMETPLKKYLELTFAGVFIRSLILGTFGGLVGEVYHTYLEKVEAFESFFLYVIIIGIVGFLSYKIYHKKYKTIKK